VKGERSGTCYSAAYTNPIRDQKNFIGLDVTPDWQELRIPQRTMRPSTAW